MVVDYNNGGVFVLKAKVELILAAILAPFIEVFGNALNIEYIPVKLILLATILIFLDLLTGLAASKHKANPITSRRLQRTVWKFLTYISFIVVISLIAEMSTVKESVFLTHAIGYVKLCFALLVVLYELTSIGENIEVILGHKLPIFHFLEKVSKAVEELIIKKLK